MTPLYVPKNTVDNFPKIPLTASDVAGLSDITNPQVPKTQEAHAPLPMATF